MTAVPRPPDPLRDGRFGWLVLDVWVARDPDGRDTACALIAAGHPGDPAEQAMPALAETLGLDARPAAHTDRPGTVYVTVTDQRCATLHVGDDLHLRRAVPPLWQMVAGTRGWVRLAVGYRVMPSDADATAFLAEIPQRPRRDRHRAGPRHRPRARQRGGIPRYRRPELPSGFERPQWNA